MPFEMLRLTPTKRGAFLPEPVSYEDKWHGLERGLVVGTWVVERLVVGDINAVDARIRDTLQEYDFTRLQHPELITNQLYDDLPPIRDTGLEFWHYAGSVQTILKETVFTMFAGGQTQGLARNMAVGFAGIVTKARAAWSRDAWVENRLNAYIAQAATLQQNLPRLSAASGVQGLAVVERQLGDQYTLARAAESLGQTEERLMAVITAETALMKLREDLHLARALAADVLTAGPAPLPEVSRLKEAFLKGYDLAGFDYEQYVPFLKVPKAPERQVTMLRRAVIGNGKMNIVITTRPHFEQQLSRPFSGSVIQTLGYRRPAIGQVNLVPQPMARGRPIPGPGVIAAEARFSGWDGNIPLAPGWASIGEGAVMPDPKLTVFTEPRIISSTLAESLSAVNYDKPVLLPVDDPLMPGTYAPALYLPEMNASVDVVPLIEAGAALLPLQPGNRVSGHLIRSAIGRNWFRQSVPGMQLNPIAGPRPSRPGGMFELFGT